MNNNYNNHVSVLLNESIEALNIKPDGIYVDCTFGRGGHSKAILNQLGTNGRLIAIDCDQTAIDYANETIKDNRFTIIKANFINLEKVLSDLDITKVDGFLFDLGVSSPQLDDPSRGFSYHEDAKLDMRMDQEQTKTAFDIVNTYSLESLINIFRKYAESNYSYQVAKKIVESREIKPIETTLALVDIIKSALPNKVLNLKKHPARVFFQAIRMEVNNELGSIQKAIACTLKFLKPKARLVVISFHSLEAKVVKDTIMNETKQDKILAYLPTTNNVQQFKIIKAKSVSEQEKTSNKRARSAKLSIIERN